MLKNLLSRNIPNTYWKVRNTPENLSTCCTCRGDGFTAKVTQGIDSYSFRVKTKDNVYRNTFSSADELIDELCTVFNTVEGGVLTVASFSRKLWA